MTPARQAVNTNIARCVGKRLHNGALPMCAIACRLYVPPTEAPTSTDRVVWIDPAAQRLPNGTWQCLNLRDGGAA